MIDTRRSPGGRWGFLLVLAACTATHLRAEFPSPRLDRIDVIGAAAGGSVELEIQGADLEGATQLLFDHPGLTALHLKDRRFKVTVAADVPPGTFDLFVRSKFGISNPKLFAVSKGFQEIAEKEPNDNAATAQAVPLDCIVNGVSDGNREDVYRFSLKKGQRIVLECHAGRLESLMDATMTLSTADGSPVASNGDYDGRDPLLDIVAPADGDYLLSVSDLSFRGGYPYRLIFNTRPQIENVFPRALQVGKANAITAFGRNLGASSTPSTLSIGDRLLDQWKDTVTPAAETSMRGRYEFYEHPTNHSVLPTAATSTLVGMQYRAKIDGFLTAAVPMVLTDGPVTLEAEPNDDPKKPQRIVLPATVSGRFDRERDADWYDFEVGDTGSYLVDVYCERIAGRADPYLVIYDDKDNKVVELDDSGIRSKAFDGFIRDPSGVVKFDAKKKYRLLVQDRYRRGGPRFQYVLSIRRQEPDFLVSAIHSQNPGPGGCNLRKGGSTYLELAVHHRDGLNAPVTIAAEGLPKGVHAIPTKIAGDTRGMLVLWADADAEDFLGPIKLIATSARPTGEVRREVRTYCRSWAQQDLNSSRPMRNLLLCVQDTAPFALTPEKDRVEIVAGGRVSIRIDLKRLWPEFKTGVTAIPLDFPGPFKMGNVTIPEGKTEATVVVEAATGSKPGEYTIALMGQGQVPFGKDQKPGAATPNTLISLPSRPILVTIVAAPAAKK